MNRSTPRKLSRVLYQLGMYQNQNFRVLDFAFSAGLGFRGFGFGFGIWILGVLLLLT